MGNGDQHRRGGRSRCLCLQRSVHDPGGGGLQRVRDFFSNGHQRLHPGGRNRQRCGQSRPVDDHGAPGEHGLWTGADAGGDGVCGHRAGQWRHGDDRGPDERRDRERRPCGQLCHRAGGDLEWQRQPGQLHHHPGQRHAERDPGQSDHHRQQCRQSLWPATGFGGHGVRCQRFAERRDDWRRDADGQRRWRDGDRPRGRLALPDHPKRGHRGDV